MKINLLNLFKFPNQNILYSKFLVGVMVEITGEELAQKQKEISISEFFEKNKHLLGFDNPTKALLIVVKEAVDNSLDACCETGILPKIKVDVKNINEDVFRLVVEDNGPGIPKQAIGKAFGKFLYGSKFHRLLQQRGQQGIGITGSVLYSQLTTSNPLKVWSKTSTEKTYFTKLMINVLKNEPDIIEEGYAAERDEIKEHGIRIQLDVVGRYRKTQSVDDYLAQTAIANPFAEIIYHAPDGRKIEYKRATDKLPKLPNEIKPHPYGVELGIFLRMLKNTKSKTILNFLTNEFSSVGSVTAKKVCKLTKIKFDSKPNEVDNSLAAKLLKNLQGLDIQRPPVDCLSPIGEEELKKGLKKQYPSAEFVATETRPPEVYRGNPFEVEIGIVYDQSLQKVESVELMRFANRAPLLFQQSACAIFKSVVNTDWKRYGLEHKKGSLPSGPCVILVHLCSVWVPFISEGKEAIASYPIIIKEIKLGLQKCARKLSAYLAGKRREHQQQKRLQIFQMYAPEIEESLSKLTDKPKDKIKTALDKLIGERARVREEIKEGEAMEEDVKKEISEDIKKSK